MTTASDARRDAREYARAQMYYGEGAGIRRKLIENSVMAKAARSQSYGRAFDSEMAKQDMAEHASKARKERERKDHNEAINRNARGLMTGNHSQLNTSVMLIAVGAAFAHKTGLDKKALAEAKILKAKLKTRYENWRNPRSNVYNITNVTTAKD